MASRSLDTDIVVVGGGPAGSAAAIACATRGLRVILLERDRFGGERPGETLHPGIEPLMTQLGLGERLATVAGARHRGIWIDWGGRRRFEPFGKEDNSPWSGFQVRRRAFDALMLDRARELAVDVRQPLGAIEVLGNEAEPRGVMTEAGPIASRMVIDASGGARWLGRKIGLGTARHSPRLIARYGYVEGSCPERDEAPALIGDSNGWTWTAKVWGDTYQWTRLAFDNREPDGGWIPAELRGLRPEGKPRGADVTWRLMKKTAGPEWFCVGDAAATLDPTSSHGVLRAIVTGITAGHLIAAALNGRAPADEAALVYDQWLARWFTTDGARLAAFYRDLGLRID